MNTRIYRLATLCAVLVALSFIVPRFFGTGGGSYGAAGSAFLVFLGMLAAALLLSVYLLLLTVSSYRHLSIGARVAGLTPAIVIGGGLVAMIWGTRY